MSLILRFTVLAIKETAEFCVSGSGLMLLLSRGAGDPDSLPFLCSFSFLLRDDCPDPLCNPAPGSYAVSTPLLFL